ncbi:oxidoreductase [Aspergillus cavernicola]|uniref:Oxidoreductase n=1 Tax=Aspergillus cavernicola TaxID=176166 RepID=A0ABR4I9B7_9EURO
MPLNTAVVGYGFSAKTFHIPFILHDPGFRLHSIVQRTPRDNDSAIKDFPDAKVYHDAYEAINDQDVDVLVITSTNDTHFPLSKRALENGKHVIVEKPFAVTYAEAAELVDLAEQRNLKLAVYHNRRWDSDFLTIHSLIKAPDNPLGEIVRFKSQFNCAPNSRTAVESKKWRLAHGVPGAGMLFDLGSHLIDQTVVLFGSPRTVMCLLFDEAGRRTVGEEGFVDDGFLIVLGYGNGLNVELHSTQYSVSDRQRRFEVLGTKGRWIKYGLDCQEDQLQNGVYPGHAEYGLERSETRGTLQVVDGDGVRIEKWETTRGGYQHFYENVHAAITGQAELSVKPKDAALVMRLIELCRQSAVEGRTLDVNN